MRDAAFLLTMLALLPIAAARPFAGILLWSWISFMNPHRLLWGAAESIPWAATIFVVTLLGCLLSGEPRRLARNAVILLLVMLMVSITLTSSVALAPPDAVWAKWDRVIKVLAGLVLTAALLTDRWRIHALVWLMVMAIGYYGVKGGLFAIVTGGNFRVWGPPQTMIEDNNHLAAAMLISLPLMNYLRMQSRHAAVKWGLVAAMALTLLATVGSYSRGALLGLAAVGVMLWLRSHRKAIAAVVVVVAIGGATGFMPEHWTERMRTIVDHQEDASASERLVVWDISWRLALDRPLVGVGFAGPYTREVVDRVEPGGPARAVHSIWFEVLGEHGFPAFVIWLGLTIAGLRYAVRLPRLARGRADLAWAGDLGRMAQVSIVAYLVSGTFLSLSYWDFYWTLLVVLGAAHALAMRAHVALPATTAAADGGWRMRAVAARAVAVP